jgi:hypothetical protein
MTIRARLDKLETDHRGKSLVVMCRHETEPQSRALARFRAEHPNGPDPAKAALQVTIIKFSDAYRPQ